MGGSTGRGRGVVLVLVRNLMVYFLLLLMYIINVTGNPVKLIMLCRRSIRSEIYRLKLAAGTGVGGDFVVDDVTLFLPIFALIPFVICCVGKTSNFLSNFLRVATVLLVRNLFSHFFVS